MKLYLDLLHTHMTSIRHSANATPVLNSAKTNPGFIVPASDLVLTQWPCSALACQCRGNP